MPVRVSTAITLSCNDCGQVIHTHAFVSKQYNLLLTPFSSNRPHLSYDGCLEVRGEISELFCVVLCTEVAHSHKHTWMSSSYSSLDWVLSHWAVSLHTDPFVFMCSYFILFSTT